MFRAWSLLSGRLRRTADRLEGWPGQTPVHQLPRQNPSRESFVPSFVSSLAGRFSIAELSFPRKTAFFLRQRPFKDLEPPHPLPLASGVETMPLHLLHPHRLVALRSRRLSLYSDLRMHAPSPHPRTKGLTQLLFYLFLSDVYVRV